MAYTTNPQRIKNNQQKQEQSEFKRRSLGDVRQDNSAPRRDSIASVQAYPFGQRLRAHPLGINSDRSKKRSIRRKTESVTAWIKKPVRGAIDEIARREGLTRSKVAARFLEWAVNETLHRQTAELIPAVIEQSFDKVVGKRLARTDNLLVRAAIDISQTRTIATNTLGRQPGVTPDTLNLILDNSLQKAKTDLTNRSPEMEEFIAAVVVIRQKEDRQERGKR